MTERPQRTQIVADDLGDRQHRHRQDRAGTPHIQYQNISARITATGLMVKRRASSIGVTISPSMTWTRKYRPTGSSAHQVTPSDSTLAIRNSTRPTIGPRIGTKFSTKAMTPQSSGLATPHAHMMPSVSRPTMTVDQRDRDQIGGDVALDVAA